MRPPVFLFVVLSLAAWSEQASAQRGRGRPPPPREPKPSEPKPSDDEDHAALLRTEPVIAPPQDPLAIPPETRERIGTDWDGRPAPPEGSLRHTSWLPYYEERRGDYRFRMIPPLFLEHTRGLPDPTRALYGEPKSEDTEGLYGLLYYRRRSLKLDMDVLFPAFWHVRDGDSDVTVAGPLVHREAPAEHDNWLAPVYFEGARGKDGGYFHSPLLLTTSHWNAGGAFTLVGPYFRDRAGSDVDWGVFPLFAAGDNGSTDGNRRTFTLVPPLLLYSNYRELEGSTLTVAGPLIWKSTPKRDVFDVAPLFFHIKGKPQSGGVTEEHTTLLPFFHYGRDPDKSLFVIPGYYRRVTRTADTMITPLLSHAEARGGATSLTAVGPVLPIVWDYSDRDLGVHAWAVAPLFYTSGSPTGRDWLTPLVGRFESYGVSRTWWVFPTFTATSDTKGWGTALHPVVYVGRSEQSSHTVLAPLFWDFASPKGRTTIGLPVYWRFAEGQDDSVVQIAGNTLYLQKRVAGGHDWSFHLLPLFSYGESPGGYFWNVLFGLAGYTRDGAQATVRALWIPFEVGAGAPGMPKAATNVVR